jgi:hypothetical protein
LNWLVPAAAATTAVALWVAVPGQRTAVVEPPRDVQVIAPPSAAPATARPTTEATPPEVIGPAREGFAAPSGQRADNQVGATESTAPPAAASADAQAPPAEGRLERDADRQRLPDEQAGVASTPLESVAEQAAPLASSARSAAIAPAGFDVVSSDPRVRWRVVPGVANSVQHSTDGGVTWTAQSTGGPAALTAGSSPSPSVCWLVGDGGVVLRTVDGGRDWQRVPFPDLSDAIAVRASTALSAVVDLADGRRLATQDGQSWAPVQK